MGYLALAVALLTAHLLPAYARSKFDAGDWTLKTAHNVALGAVWCVFVLTTLADNFGVVLRPGWTVEAIVAAVVWVLYRANQLDLVQAQKPVVEPLNLGEPKVR